MTTFERATQRCPEVIRCSELAGEVDYLLEANARAGSGGAKYFVLFLPPDRHRRIYRTAMGRLSRRRGSCKIWIRDSF